MRRPNVAAAAILAAAISAATAVTAPPASAAGASYISLYNNCGSAQPAKLLRLSGSKVAIDLNIYRRESLTVRVTAGATYTAHGGNLGWGTGTKVTAPYPIGGKSHTKMVKMC